VLSARSLIFFRPPFVRQLKPTQNVLCVRVACSKPDTRHGSLCAVPVMRNALILFGIAPAPSVGPAAPPCLRPTGRNDREVFLCVLKVAGVETYATTVRAQTSRTRQRRAVETMENPGSDSQTDREVLKIISTSDSENRCLDIFGVRAFRRQSTQERKALKATTWRRRREFIRKRRRAFSSSTTLDVIMSCTDRYGFRIFVLFCELSCLKPKRAELQWCRIAVIADFVKADSWRT
jgi:hypothetical protein